MNQDEAWNEAMKHNGFYRPLADRAGVADKWVRLFLYQAEEKDFWKPQRLRKWIAFSRDLLERAAEGVEPALKAGGKLAEIFK